MAKVHKSCDIIPGDARPMVVSLGEQARRLVRGTLRAGPAVQSGPDLFGAGFPSPSPAFPSPAFPSSVAPGAAAGAAPGVAPGAAPGSVSGMPSGVAPGAAVDINPELIRQAGEQLLAQAGAEAGRLVQEARRQAIEIEREAYAAGYEAGCRQAGEEQEASRRQMAGQMQALAGDLERRSLQQLELLEPEILELSLQVAEKVIGHELSRSDQAFRSLVRAALTQLKQSGRICVRVSAQDAGWLTEGVAAGLPFAGSFQVQGERELPDGSCLIETDSGLVDASVPMQLRRIRETLQEPGP